MMDDKRLGNDAARRLWLETYADFLERPDRKTAGLLLLMERWHPDWMIDQNKLAILSEWWDAERAERI